MQFHASFTAQIVQTARSAHTSLIKHWMLAGGVPHPSSSDGEGRPLSEIRPKNTKVQREMDNLLFPGHCNVNRTYLNKKLQPKDEKEQQMSLTVIFLLPQSEPNSTENGKIELFGGWRNKPHETGSQQSGSSQF